MNNLRKALFKNSFKINEVTNCWEWQKYRQRNGYGQYKWGAQMALSHRVSWEIYCGPIPDGIWVLHKCDNPSCVNPSHLWLGTNNDNSKDMVLKKRQARVRGESNGNSKLTEVRVLKIRADRRSQREIAAAYGISQATLSDIKTRKVWSHI